MKNLASLSSVLLLLVVLLSACGGNTGPQSGPVTLRYEIWDKDQAPAFEQIAKDFKKTHPNINVSIEVTPFNQYWTKLETSATGGSAPDIAWMNGPNFLKYASNDVILPLDKQIAADKVDLKNYPPAMVSLYTYNGKHYALPKDFDTVGLWYNKTMFDAAGVKYPDASWTWNTLRDAARKLTNPAKAVWGIAAQLADQEGYYNTILQNDGYVISNDKKSSGFDKPETLGGLGLWIDLINHNWSPNLEQMTDTPPISLFESGKVAMLYGGDWNAIEFGQNQYTRNKVDVAVMPQGKKRAAVIHGIGNVIFASTRYPQAAWEFVKYLGSKEAANTLASTGTVIPAYNGTQNRWVKSFPQFHLQVFLDELAYTYPYPVSKNTAAWLDIQNRVLTEVWAEQMSLNDGGKQLAQQMDQVLAAEQQS